MRITIVYRAALTVTLCQHNDARVSDSAASPDQSICRSGGTMQGCNIDDPDLSLCRLFDRWPETASVFLWHRMFCFGCPIAPFHTVIDACLEYGLDEATFRAELRASVTSAAGKGLTGFRPAFGTAAPLSITI